MKKRINITASFDKPDLLECMIEELAYRRNETSTCEAIVPGSVQAISTSSTETYVSGTVEFNDKKDVMRIPFITSFLFTCIRGTNEGYKLNWAISCN